MFWPQQLLRTDSEGGGRARPARLHPELDKGAHLDYVTVTSQEWVNQTGRRCWCRMLSFAGSIVRL